MVSGEKKVRQNLASADTPQFTRVRADPDAIVQAMKQAGLSCYALPESQGIFVGTCKLIVHPLADGTHARTMRQVLHAYGFKKVNAVLDPAMDFANRVNYDGLPSEYLFK